MVIWETTGVMNNAIIKSGVNMTSLEKGLKSDCCLPVEHTSQGLLVSCQGNAMHFQGGY